MRGNDVKEVIVMRTGTKIGDAVVWGLLTLGLALGVTDVVKGNMRFNTTYSVSFAYENQISDFNTAPREKVYGNDSIYIKCTYADNDTAEMKVSFAYWDPDYNVVYINGDTAYLHNGEQQWVESNIPSGYLCVPYGQLTYDGWEDETESGGYFVGRWRPDNSIVD